MSGGKHLAKGNTIEIRIICITQVCDVLFSNMPFHSLTNIYDRTHLILDAKQIPYHSIYINLSDKPDWLFEVNAQGKVPAIELVNEEGKPTLSESLIICEYLDEKYGDKPLYPKDPLRKAQEKILIDRLSPVIGAFFKASDGGPLEPFWSSLECYEQELRTRGTLYYGGEEPGILDYMLWPWCERLELLQVQRGEDYNFDGERFQQLAKWLELMKGDAAVQAFYVDGETQAEFLRTREAGAPIYDLLVKED